MTKEEHLLVCLSEECAEVIKEVNKALRFGLDDVHPRKITTNRENIESELNDLYGVLEFLGESGLLFERDSMAITKKKEKVKHYIEYAVWNGTVTGERAGLK